MGVVFKLRMIALSPQIHYGGSIQITSDNNIPSSSSHCECTKGAMIWRISKNTLTYPKEKIGVLTTSNCDLLQFVYRIYPRITLTVAVLFIYPLNWQPARRYKKCNIIQNFQKVYNCPHFTRDFIRTAMRTNYKAPHLIATRTAFCQGAFSKIQSMFTISPHIKTLGKDES